MVKGARLWGVVALSLLSGSGWVLTQGWPSEMRWPFGACLHFGLIGLVGLAVAALQRAWNALSWLRAVSVCLAGMCLFALPAVVLRLTVGTVSELTRVAVFCAVPLVTVVTAGAFAAEDDETSRLRGLMAPSIAGLCGALLLFPLESPGSLRRWFFLCLVIATCVVVAIASVWMHRVIQGVGVTAAVAVVGLGTAAALGFYGTTLGWSAIPGKTIAEEALRCVIFDLPVVWLTVWLIRETNPARLSARFLFAPLVTAVEGYAVMRPTIEAKTIVALLLLCAGGVLLLVRDESEQLPGLRLR